MPGARGGLSSPQSNRGWEKGASRRVDSQIGNIGFRRWINVIDGIWSIEEGGDCRGRSRPRTTGAVESVVQSKGCPARGCDLFYTGRPDIEGTRGGETEHHRADEGRQRDGRAEASEYGESLLELIRKHCEESGQSCDVERRARLSELVHRHRTIPCRWKRTSCLLRV